MQSYIHNNNDLLFISKVEEEFNKAVKHNDIKLDNMVKNYAWSIDEMLLDSRSDLLELSISSKTAIYMRLFGYNKCFDLNCCSALAINYILVDNAPNCLGVILDTPFLVNSIISPDFRLVIEFRGMIVKAATQTSFELFSAGVRDVCEQMKQRISNPILVSSTLKTLLDTNLSLDAYAKELEMLKVSIDEVKK